MINKIYNSFTTLEKLMLNIGTAILAILGVWVFSDAMGRYLFNHPIPGTLEICEEILMILLVFFSMSYCQKVDGHVKVELFRQYIPEKILHILDRVMELVVAFYVLMVVYTAIQQFNTAVLLHSTSRGVLAYPLAPIYMLVAFGMAVFFIRLIFEVIKGKENLPDANDLQDTIEGGE